MYYCVCVHTYCDGYQLRCGRLLGAPVCASACGASVFIVCVWGALQISCPLSDI